MSIIYTSLIVFAIVLTITKSKILAGKREFVEKRYESAKINGKPSWIHLWWRSQWLCPMCSGFYISAFICLFTTSYNYVFDVLICYGLNWLWHCLESLLFFSGKYFENKWESDSKQV